jgi:hypothetical protein
MYCMACVVVCCLQERFPAVKVSVVNLARGAVDVTPASMCWYQYVPQVRYNTFQIAEAAALSCCKRAAISSTRIQQSSAHAMMAADCISSCSERRCQQNITEQICLEVSSIPTSCLLGVLLLFLQLLPCCFRKDVASIDVLHLFLIWPAGCGSGHG